MVGLVREELYPEGLLKQFAYCQFDGRFPEDCFVRRFFQDALEGWKKKSALIPRRDQGGKAGQTGNRQKEKYTRRRLSMIPYGERLSKVKNVFAKTQKNNHLTD